jgi:5S rRNA maturation endonuclease (ribonuclease M5)
MKRNSDFEIFEDLEEYVQRLNSACDAGAVVVVEGRRDKMALRSIGIRGTVLMLCQNNSLRLLANQIGNRKAILLFDNDREGESLLKRAKKYLSASGVTVDDSHRKFLLPVTRGKIRQIEDLMSFRQKIVKNIALIL